MTKQASSSGAFVVVVAAAAAAAAAAGTEAVTDFFFLLRVSQSSELKSSIRRLVPLRAIQQRLIQQTDEVEAG